MTINPQVSEVTYLGNNVTTSFTFPFVGVAASDIKVLYTDALGNQTLINPSLYTLTLNPVSPGSLWGVGGTVVYPIAGSPIATGTSITIVRTVPYAQTVSISNQGAFYPQVVEQALDLLELQIQQLATGITDLTARVVVVEGEISTINSEITTINSNISTINSEITDLQIANGKNLRVSDTSLITLPNAASRKNKYIAFDNNGQPIVLYPSPLAIVYGIPRRIDTSGVATITVSTLDSSNGVSIYQSGSPVTTVQLPPGYGPYTIWDGSLNADSYPITILPPAGMTIMGNANFVIMFKGQSVTFYNDRSQILIG